MAKKHTTIIHKLPSHARFFPARGHEVLAFTSLTRRTFDNAPKHARDATKRKAFAHESKSAVGLCGENRNTKGRPRLLDSPFAFRIEKSNRFIKFAPFVCFLLACGKSICSIFPREIARNCAGFSDFRKIWFLQISCWNEQLRYSTRLFAKPFQTFEHDFVKGIFDYFSTSLEIFAKERLDKSNFLTSTQIIRFRNILSFSPFEITSP